MQIPEWLQVVGIMATIITAAVAALATMRAASIQRDAKRLEIESQERLRAAEQVHTEAKGIWTDATSMRDELRRESERLRKERDELEAEKDAWIAERREMRDRIAALERRVDDLACLRAPECEREGRRLRPGK